MLVFVVGLFLVAGYCEYLSFLSWFVLMQLNGDLISFRPGYLEQISSFDLTPPRFVEALVTPPNLPNPQLYTGAEQCLVTLDSFHLSFCLAALSHMIWVQINHSGKSESCVWLLTCSFLAPFGLRFSFLFLFLKAFNQRMLQSHINVPLYFYLVSKWC